MASTGSNLEGARGFAEFDFSQDGHGVNHHQHELDAVDLRGIMAGPYTAEDITEQPQRNYTHDSFPSDYGTEHLHRSGDSSPWNTAMSSNANHQDRRDSWEKDKDDDEGERKANACPKDRGEDGDEEDDLSFHEIKFGDGQPRMSAEIPHTHDHSRSPRFLGAPLDMGHEEEEETVNPRSAGRSVNTVPVDLEAQKPGAKPRGRLIPILCVAAWLTIPVIATFGMFGALTSHVRSNHENGAPA